MGRPEPRCRRRPPLPPPAVGCAAASDPRAQKESQTENAGKDRDSRKGWRSCWSAPERMMGRGSGGGGVTIVGGVAAGGGGGGSPQGGAAGAAWGRP